MTARSGVAHGFSPLQLLAFSSLVLESRTATQSLFSKQALTQVVFALKSTLLLKVKPKFPSQCSAKETFCRHSSPTSLLNLNEMVRLPAIEIRRIYCPSSSNSCSLT